MRARTSASQVCGSISFILVVTIMPYITAARSPPRSEPQNNQDFLPRAMPRTPRSAALFDRQVRPSSRKRVKLGALLSHPGLQSGDQRCAELLSNGPAPCGALSVDRPLDLEQLIDPPDRFERQRRDRHRLFALRLAASVLGQIRHHEERTPGLDPTSRFQDKPRAGGRVLRVCRSRRRRQPARFHCSWPDEPADARRRGRASSRTPPPAALARHGLSSLT